MENKAFEDVYSRISWQKTATINLQPDTLNWSTPNDTKHKVRKENDLNEIQFSNVNPEAKKGGQGGGSRDQRRRQGSGGGKRGRTGGTRKRHPNFAARNRKIGKGGPTGKGGLRGTKKRRRTIPRPPENSGDEPETNYQEVDQRTGRTKRRQRPKSDRIKEKLERRKYEDNARKSEKKIRPGPKAKDRTDMKEKVKRFWRETPKPKDKRAPKFIGEGLESEKEERKSEPEDFDDLRMPSKEQLKKLKKARIKEVQRKKKKQERKSQMKDMKEHKLTNLPDDFIGGDYVPTFSEIEGIEGNLHSYMEDKTNNNKGLPKLKLKLKPKPKNGSSSEIENNKVKGSDFSKSLQDPNVDFKSFLEQPNDLGDFDNNVNNDEPVFQLKKREPEDESKRLRDDTGAAQPETCLEFNQGENDFSDLYLINKEKPYNGEEDENEYLPKHYEDEASKLRKRSSLEFEVNLPKNKSNESSYQVENDYSYSSSNLKEEGLGHDSKQLENYTDNYESINGSLAIDEDQYDPKLLKEFEEEYESLKEYLKNESESSEDNLLKKAKDISDGGLESATEQDEVWDRHRKKFRKQQKKKRKKTAFIDCKGSPQGNKLDRDSQDLEPSVLASKYNSMYKDNVTAFSEPKTMFEKQHSQLGKEKRGRLKSTSESETQSEKHHLNDLEQFKNIVPKYSKKSTGSKLTGEYDNKSTDVKGEIDERNPKLNLKPTGTVVDDKLDMLYNSFEKMSKRENNKFKYEIDDVGQLLYNDDDPMLKFQGESTEEEWQEESNYKDLDMNDYENYAEISAGSKFTAVPADGSQGFKSKDDGKEIKDEKSEATDTTEEESSSDSFREEYDVALMAGLRSDRIRVFDRNVRMYADQDHQANKLPINESQELKTLSDIEYERLKNCEEFSYAKPCDDDILVSTENEEPKPKKNKSGRKKSQDKISIPSETDIVISKEEDPMSGKLSKEGEESAKLQSLGRNDLFQTEKINISGKSILEVAKGVIQSPTTTDIKDSENPTQPVRRDMGAPNAIPPQNEVHNAPLDSNNTFIGDTTQYKYTNKEAASDTKLFQRELTQIVSANEDGFAGSELPRELPITGPTTAEEKDADTHAELDDRHKSDVTDSTTFQSEERTPVVEAESKIEGDKLVQTSDPPSPRETLMEESSVVEIKDEALEGSAVVPSNSLTEPPFKLRKGINEYLEEDRWEMWYRFLALMNNNTTRSYDNCVALFKAKKQEILTRTTAPIPPWEEPGLDDYEIQRRKLQREWEKTERYHALRNHKFFNQFIHDNEGEPLEDELDSELEDTYRTIFDLMNASEKTYDHQAYKDSLSREELAEIYSDEEVEEELRGRELRKKGTDFESEIKKGQASGDVIFNQLPPVDHVEESLDEVLIDQPATQFSDYDTVPDWIKNDHTNPINYKIYSKKMASDFERSTNLPSVNEQSKESYGATSENQENNETNSQLSKGEQAKQMWHYFLQLMKDRHEKNIEKFLSLTSSTRITGEEEARKLWLQYVSFTSGTPMNTKMTESSPTDQFASEEATRQTNAYYVDSGNHTDKPAFSREQNDSSLSEPAQELTGLPSVGWKTLMQRIAALKMDPTSTSYSATSSQQMASGQPRTSQENLPNSTQQPYQNSSYHNIPYPQYQPQEQFSYKQGQGYSESSSRPPPRQQEQFYDPSVYQQQMSGYEYPPQASPQPRGLQGMNQYMQTGSHRGDQVDPYNRPLPPNVSFNRVYNTPEMGFQNPYFTGAIPGRAAYTVNQPDLYNVNRSRVGWPGDHSDKFHNRKYFVPDMGGQQTYVPRNFSDQPGDHSNRYYNRSNFRNPNFGYRDDTYSRHPFARASIDPNDRSIRGWQSGTRPLASSGLQLGPTISTGSVNHPDGSFVPENQNHVGFNAVRPDSTWPPQAYPGQTELVEPSQPSLQSEPFVDSSRVPPEE